MEHPNFRDSLEKSEEERNVLETTPIDFEDVEIIFEKETEKWREKMIKVFGDLHPYNFFITHGHSDDKCFTDEDAHILSRERKKMESFEKLQDMHEEDNKAEEEFHRFLKERKRECVAVFEQYDGIVTLCEEENIANYIRDVAVTRSNRIEEVYADMSTQPLIMEVWSICAEAVTSKDVWCSFLKTQQETALLWKKAFDDLLVND
ncbi:uncharacterized protein TNCT_668561 [Trichonephila clavata]|uniref:Uncharacterized protein n=1 Tax=Trichonephila clavata TaxID=2740835 RepID=A0A8X6GZA5_TRICU|nr:uncharacterized protein TNCT_668561 [Trichonephila clavata]